MADWYISAVEYLLELKKKDPHLVKLIRATIKTIERHPTIGKHIIGTRWMFIDFEHQFRVGYNFHSDAKEIEIVSISLF